MTKKEPRMVPANDPEAVEEPGVDLGLVGEVGVAARRADVGAGAGLDAEQAARGPVRVGLPQGRDPLGRLPDHHPRVVQRAGDQQVGTGAGGRQVVVGRVRLHPRELLGIPRVAPLVPLVHGQRDARVEHRGDDVDERHLGDHGPPAVRPLAEHRALQQAAGAQPAGGDPVWVDQAGQAVGHRDVVGEGVLLVLQAPVEPPTATASPPPRTWACTNTTPRSSSAGSAGSHSGLEEYS
jgi:hypothetical protein